MINTDSVNDFASNTRALRQLVEDESQGQFNQDEVDGETSALADKELRFQAALSALMMDKGVRDFARADGPRFQRRYGLTDKQMIALALVAIHTGEATLHRELADMQIHKTSPDAPVGSCCCSCP
jgi:hypothetical protein